MRCPFPRVGQKVGMRFLVLALAGLSLAACFDPSSAPPEEAPAPAGSPTAAGVEISTRYRTKVGTDGDSFEALFLAPSSLSALDPNGSALRTILDSSHWTCPFPHATDPALGVRAEDTQLVTVAQGRAYFSNPLCGAWSVSLDDPSRVTPLFDSPASTAISEDARFMCVVVRTPGQGLDPFDHVEHWSVNAEGERERMLDRVPGRSCTEVSGSYLVIDDQLYRGYREVVGVQGRPRDLRQSGYWLYFFDDRGLERMDVNGGPLELIEACRERGDDKADPALPECPTYLPVFGDLYLARKIVGERGSEIVVRHKGSTEEEVVYRTAEYESIYLPSGLALTKSTSAKHLWFVLEWRKSPELDPKTAYLAKVSIPLQ